MQILRVGFEGTFELGLTFRVAPVPTYHAVLEKLLVVLLEGWQLRPLFCLGGILAPGQGETQPRTLGKRLLQAGVGIRS